MKNLLLIGIALFSFYTIKAQEFTSNGIKYSILGETNTVSVEPNTQKYTGNIVIPSTVSYNSKSYTVIYIDASAFSRCTRLTSITLPNTVKYIGDGAFRDCSGLTSITLPNSLTSIGVGAFENCSILSTITIPNSVMTIERFAFDGCSGLTSITLPNSLTSIGEYTFRDCSKLISITLPNTLTDIGDNAFSYCSKLTSIKIPNTVTYLGDRAFSACSGLTSITLPNTITSIGAGTFHYCKGLTSIKIPNTVTYIGDYAFYGCSGLISVTLPNTVTYIGNLAFYECSGLTSITLPNTVTYIGDVAFARCSGLTSLICEAIIPPTLGSTDVKETNEIVFSGVNKTIPLHVPESSVDLYKAALQWKDFNVQTLSTVNTNNISIQPKLKLFPNPATSVITIEIPNNNSQSNLLMFDNTGSLVLNKQLFGTTQISIDELKSGMYLYQHTQDGIVTNGKLIVK